MFGQGGNTFRTVVGLVKDWRPTEAYGHEREFQSELQDYLDEHLNNGGGILDGGTYAVSTERGASRGDVVINDQIGIELKRDFTNSQKKKLRGQLEDYADHYDYVIACACGISDMDGWRDLEKKVGNNGPGIGLQQTQFEFIIKREENFGTDPQDDDFLGGGLF